MKTVFSNHHEVAHVWASQSQSNGEASHMFFDGPSIYSYGRHFEIARIIRPGVVFFNPESYSVSTSKHQGRARSAVSHMKAFTVPSMTDHNENAQYLLTKLETELFRISRMRKDGAFWLGQYVEQVEKVWEYAAIFKIRKELFVKISDTYAKREKPLTPELLEKFKVQALAARAETKKKKEEQRKRDDEYRAELQVKYDAWKRGEGGALPWEMNNIFPTALRVKDNEIQTTRGASIPIIEARKFWHIYRAGGAIEGIHLGHYTVTHIKDNSLIVGCHTVALKEVARMAFVLGFEKEILPI